MNYSFFCFFFFVFFFLFGVSCFGENLVVAREMLEDRKGEF